MYGFFITFEMLLPVTALLLLLYMEYLVFKKKKKKDKTIKKLAYGYLGWGTQELSIAY